MKVWFMRDNHTFAPVGDSASSRADMEAEARKLFASERGCGLLFACDHKDKQIAELQDHPGGVTRGELSKFFDRVDEHVNWLARG
jgi:hypothetical protein